MKNMNCLALITSLLLTPSLYAGNEDHGGETIIINGQYVPLDEISGYSKVEGKDFKVQLSQWAPVVAALSKVNWYLSETYEREIEKLVFFMGEKPITDCGFEGKNKIFAACRNGNIVKIDRRIFNAYTEERKTTLAIHEVTHSFVLPQETPQELEDTVTEFTNLVIRNFRNQISPDLFEIKMSDFNIALPKNAVEFQAARTSIETALNDSSPLPERIKAAFETRSLKDELLGTDKGVYATLLQLDSRLYDAVTSGDNETIDLLLSLNADPKTVVSSEIIEYLVEIKNVSLLRTLVLDGKVTSEVLRTKLWGAISKLPTLKAKESAFI